MVVASTSASRCGGSSAVTGPFTVKSDTAPVSPNVRIRARTPPFTDTALTGPADVSASTSPLTVEATIGALAPVTCTPPFTVVAPTRTRRGRRTVNSTATSLRRAEPCLSLTPSPPGSQPPLFCHTAQIDTPPSYGTATRRTLAVSYHQSAFT